MHDNFVWFIILGLLFPVSTVRTQQNKYCRGLWLQERHGSYNYENNNTTKVVLNADEQYFVSAKVQVSTQTFIISNLQPTENII